jgi:ribonuclease HI
VLQRASTSIQNFEKARADASEIHTSSNPSFSIHRARTPNKVKWKKPEKDSIKLNSDVNLSIPDLWGIGVIARNDEGLAMASGTWHRPGFNCATTAEAWGIYQALIFAGDCGFSRVEFESDNEKVVKMLNGSEEECKGYLGSIVDSILSLSSNFNQCSFSHVRRSGNGLAHFLAKLALADPDKVWMEDVPSNATSLYFSDLIG